MPTSKMSPVTIVSSLRLRPSKLLITWNTLKQASVIDHNNDNNNNQNALKVETDRNQSFLVSAVAESGAVTEVQLWS